MLRAGGQTVRLCCETDTSSGLTQRSGLLKISNSGVLRVVYPPLTKTIVLSIFGVCVNFKIRTFQRSAVQFCSEMALGKGRGEGRLL